MYSEADLKQVDRRLRNDMCVIVPVAALLLAAFVVALSQRIQWLAMVSLPLLFVAVCYAWIARLWPNMCYKRFLTDMVQGLSRDREGTIVEISRTSELQDGCVVLPVRILLTEEQDERIVYLNVDKAGDFPKEGQQVRLKCFGRHIKQAEALG